jgi:hypothetical protein
MPFVQDSRDFELVGEELGRSFIRFQRYSPPKKLLVLFSFIFICGLPYYFIFYNLMPRVEGNRLRGV